MAEDIPQALRYTDQHEWVRIDGDVVTVGITAFAQDQLGDVVYVDLPTAGATVDQGQAIGEVESTKSVSDLYAPVAGEILSRNEELDERPELINADPYGEGWLVTLRVSDPAQAEALLDAAGYAALLDG
ncbi:MAG: glycine cleavage system protein GcvH [Nitriliruptoraceae bacterium]